MNVILATIVQAWVSVPDIILNQNLGILGGGSRRRTQAGAGITCISTFEVIQWKEGGVRGGRKERKSVCACVCGLEHLFLPLPQPPIEEHGKGSRPGAYLYTTAGPVTAVAASQAVAD